MKLAGLFLFNDELDNILDNLEPTEVVELLRMLDKYNCTGEVPKTDNRIVRLMFSTLKGGIDNKKEQLEINRRNGKKGGRPKKEVKEDVEEVTEDVEDIEDVEDSTETKEVEEDKTETEKKQNKPNKTENNQMKPNKRLSKSKSKSESKTKSKTETEALYPPDPPLAKGESESVAVSEQEKAETAMLDMQKKAKAQEKKDVQARFERFWQAYPRKDNKAKAQAIFIKLKVSDELLQSMLGALEQQKKLEQWQSLKYVPMATTYLNNKRWEDEIVLDKPKSKLTHQNYTQREYDEDEYNVYQFDFSKK